MFKYRLEPWTLYCSGDIFDCNLSSKVNATLNEASPINLFFNDASPPPIFPKRKLTSLNKKSILSFVPNCFDTLIAIHDSLDHRSDWRGYLETAHIDYAWRKIIEDVAATAHFLKWSPSDKAMTETQLLSLAEMFQDITNSGLTDLTENALCFKQIAQITSYFDAAAYLPSAELQARASCVSDKDDGSSNDNSSTPSICLKGLRVTIVRDSIVPWDLRLHNQSRALLSAGAKVSVVGRLEGKCKDFLDERVSFCDTMPPIKQPALGKEHVWYPLRVATNLSWIPLMRVVRKLKSYNSARVKIKRTQPDILQVYDIHLASEAFKAVSSTQTKVILDIRDLIAAEGYTTGLKARVYQSLEQKYTTLADKVISVSRPSADYLQEKYSLKDISVISNVLPKPVRFKPKESKKIRFLFQGAYRPNRNLLALIRAMSEVQDRAELSFQGWGPMQPLMELLVKQLKLEDSVHFIPPCSPQDTGEFAKQFDFGVICYSGSTTNLQLTVPVKIFAYLNAGLAVMVTDLPGPKSILKDSLAANYITSTSWEGIAEALKNIVDSSFCINERRAAAYDLADIWSWENEELKYLEIYKELQSEQW